VQLYILMFNCGKCHDVAFPSILGIVSHVTRDELHGGILYALHAFGAQLFIGCDLSFRDATIGQMCFGAI